MFRQLLAISLLVFAAVSVGFAPSASAEEADYCAIAAGRLGDYFHSQVPVSVAHPMQQGQPIAPTLPGMQWPSQLPPRTDINSHISALNGIQANQMFASGRYADDIDRAERRFREECRWQQQEEQARQRYLDWRRQNPDLARQLDIQQQTGR